MTFETIAAGLVWVFQVYAAAGLLFAVAFVWRGAQALDPAAKGAGWGFRLLILPGSVAFWPLLAWRWARRAPLPEECTEHRCRAGEGGR